MSKVAIKPGAPEKPVLVARSIRNVFVTDNSRWGSYGWGTEYTVFIWRRLFLIFFLTLAPVCFLAFGPSVLLGWLVWLVPAGAIRISNQNSSTLQVESWAYSVVQQLKDGWAKHGQQFYSQIYNHNCNHKNVLHSHTHGCGYGEKCDRIVAHCNYCNRRAVELKLLLRSQQSVETKTVNDVSDELFEASQQFRQAVEDERKMLDSSAMKEVEKMVQGRA